ncbi:uncharacterized protein METZ01_LOCUS484828, partial [marine metagenome]
PRMKKEYCMCLTCLFILSPGAARPNLLSRAAWP